MGDSGAVGAASGTPVDGAGKPNPPPPSAPPIPPGKTDSITLLFTFSIIASLRMYTVSYTHLTLPTIA